MNIVIKDLEKEYNISLVQFTQLCGINFVKKDFILNSIIRYFSNYKYQDYEINMMDNVYLDNGEKLCSNYFRIILINNRNDILNLIKLTKTSLLQEYINKELEGYDLQVYKEQIRDILDKMYFSINDKIINELGNIRLDYSYDDFFSIIQKSNINSINDVIIEENTNYELLFILISIVKKIQETTPQKLLIIIKDIDHLITYNEYLKIYKIINELIKHTDTYILTSLSINDFPIIDANSIEGINVVNDLIFQFENYDKYKEYIVNNYPINIDFTNEELTILTNMIIHYIGKNNIKNDIKSIILLKLLDKSMAINCDSSTKINNIEISFLNS